MGDRLGIPCAVGFFFLVFLIFSILFQDDSSINFNNYEFLILILDNFLYFPYYVYSAHFSSLNFL